MPLKTIKPEEIFNLVEEETEKERDLKFAKEMTKKVKKPLNKKEMENME